MVGRIGHVLWIWAIRPICTLLVARTVYAVVQQLLRVDPGQWLATAVLSTPSFAWVEIGRWAVLGVPAIGILIAYEMKWRPRTGLVGYPPSVIIAPAAPIKPPITSGSPQRDTWVRDAAMYALNGKWPLPDDRLEEGQSDDALAVLNKMREYAGDGKLNVWGKAGPNHLPELIEPAFWVHNHFDFLRVIFDDPEKSRTDTVTSISISRRYTALQVNKAQIEELWPSGTQEIPLNKAAEQAFAALHGTAFGNSIEQASGFGTGGPSTEEILRLVMLNMARHGGEVTGLKWPDNKRVPVPFTGLKIYPVENCLRYRDNDRPVYTELMITQAAVDEFVRYGKNISGSI